MPRIGLLVGVLLAAVPSAAAAQFARVSVSSAGGQANGPSETPELSGDGRLVLFASRATNLVPGDTNGVSDIFLHDRDADGDGVFDEPGAIETRRVSVLPDGTQANGDSTRPRFIGSTIVFLSRATNLVPGLTTPVQRVFGLPATGAPFVLLSRGVGGMPAEADCDALVVGSSSSGYAIVYRSSARTLAPGDPGNGGAIYASSWIGQVVLDAVRLSPPLYPGADGIQPTISEPTVTSDGGLIAFAAVTVRTGTAEGRLFVNSKYGNVLSEIGAGVQVAYDSSGTAVVLDRTQPGGGPTSRRLSTTQAAPVHGGPTVDPRSILVSHLGRFAAFVEPDRTVVHDFFAGESDVLPIGGLGGASWDRLSRFLAVASPQALVSGDTNALTDVLVVDLWRYFDVDADGLDDRWERISGLDPTSAIGDAGALGDPDGDGLTNAQEFATAGQDAAPAAVQHPTGVVHRYFAEAVDTAFFQTTLAIVNPDAVRPASVLLRYRNGTLRTLTQPLRVPPLGRRSVRPAVVGAYGQDFSIEIESDRPVVVDREVRWDATGYGASIETSQVPSTSWYVAEGTTAADFALFYLLHNPEASPVAVTIRYLRASGAPIERTYELPAHSRTTIEVEAVDPALRHADVSATFDAAVPIVVERALYASRHGRPFALGHTAAGARSTATSWFLAEGATGAFFDLYVLVANPAATAANVTLEFLRPDGTIVSRPLMVPASARRSVYVDGIAGLEATAVSTRVVSDVPVVVERAMYWPGGFYDYEEGHASIGSTAAATRWVLAQGDDGGPRDARSYVLIANVAGTPGEARVTLLGEHGVNTSQVVALPANSRVTLRAGAGRTDPFGVLVESLGASAAPIVVEGSYYWNAGGQVWAAGGNVLATPLP